MKYFFISLLALCAYVYAGTHNPGIVVDIRNDLIHATSEVLQKIMFEKTQLPSKKGSAYLISYNLHNLESEVLNGGIKLFLDEKRNSVTVEIKDLEMHLTGNVKVSAAYIPITSGSFNVVEKIKYASVEIKFGSVEKDGHVIPKIEVGEFDMNLDDIKPDVQIRNLPTFVINMVMGKINSTIEENRKDFKNKATTALNTAFESLVQKMQILNLGDIGLSMTTALAQPGIKIKSKSVNMNFEGTFYNKQGKQVPFDNTFEAPSIKYDSKRNIQVILSQYSLNSLLNAFTESKLNSFKYQNDLMTIGSLHALFPQIHLYFRPDIKIAITLALCPQYSHSILLQENAFLYFHTSDGKAVISMDLLVTQKIQINTYKESMVEYIYPQIEDVSIVPIQIIHSNIGKIDLEDLNLAFKYFTRGAHYFINRVLEEKKYPIKSITKDVTVGFNKTISIEMNELTMSFHEEYIKMGVSVKVSELMELLNGLYESC